MKILVTGGAGYIGSHTIIELINAGVEVISADNFLNSSDKTFERIKAITGKDVYNYTVDLCDREESRVIFEENPDIGGIIHFAALKSVPESVEKPLFYYHNNLNSLINILELACEYGVSNFIFSSSCSVYGNLSSLPVKESTPFQKAESPYGYTKQIGETIVQDLALANKHIKHVILRYFNPVGAHTSGLIGELPNGRPNNLVPVITQTASGIIEQMQVFGNDYATRDKTCVRDYIHVTDIADAHVKAIQALVANKLKPQVSIYNLGTGAGITVLEAIHAFENVSEKKLNYVIAPRRAGDVEAIYSDSTKAEQELGWKPKFSIEQMMDTAWKWQQYLNKNN